MQNMLSPILPHILNLKKRKNPRAVFTVVILMTFLAGNCQTARKIVKHSNFDYRDVYQGKYVDGDGGIIRVTLEKGETYSGSITPNQKYLFYTSNHDGNFDIFMRPLNDINSIAVVRGSTNQTEPAISPDGKHLLFVDDELDPEGDIVSVKINPASVTRVYARSGQAAVDTLFVDSKVYLTNDLKNITRSRESNPVWSPNGKWIAYASNRSALAGNRFGPGFGARQNLWIMPANNPAKARQLTKDGATMPSFSPDGSRILFVNEENVDSAEGPAISHLYEIDIASECTRQITFDNAIDLSPGYSTDGKNIIFTRIFNDTNKDGIVDYKDHGQVLLLPYTASASCNDQKQTSQSQAVLLTTKDENIFNTKTTSFLGGSILFAMKEGDNINLGVIPESGMFARQKSSIEQLEYAKAMVGVSPENARIALSQIEYAHAGDPVKDFTATLRDFELLRNAGTPGIDRELDKEKILFQINAKIAQNDLFEKAMLDLYSLSGQARLEYLGAIYENPNSVLGISVLDIKEAPKSRKKKKKKEEDNEDLKEDNGQKPVPIPFSALSKKDQTILGYLFEQYAQVLFSQGKLDLAQKVYEKILSRLPEYYNNDKILFTLGKKSFNSEIAPEFLHILSPQKFPYTIREESASQPTETTAAKGHPVHIVIGPHVKTLTENEVFTFFKQTHLENRELSSDLAEKYSREHTPFIHGLAQLAMASNLTGQGKHNEAMSALGRIDTAALGGSEWIFKYALLHAQVLEKLNNIEAAQEGFVNALMLYEAKYRLPEIDQTILKVFSYYKKLAGIHQKSGAIDKAWNAYKRLLDLVLYLEPRKIAPGIVERSSLSIFTELDEMLLNNYHADNPTIKSAIGYYADNVEFARKKTINSFIFGRAYLNAMLGIRLHQSYESKRELNKVNKENVLTYFYQAEEDFQWSIYADPSFADSYVMLGWMYQFIDEKRDSIVYIYKQGEETGLDKELFKSLYDKYFPEYLFEKNIQLYQKSIAFVAGKSSTQVLQSFYLNLANNYFLLNNYSKAAEFYAKISTGGENRMVFENKDQEAQYYFHQGKTNYFLGNYNEATDSLEKALKFYPEISPRTAGRFSKAELSKLYVQRSTILKYIGLVSSDSGRYKKAVEAYKQILAMASQTNAPENLSMVHLEISRNLLAHMKLTHDLHEVGEALGYTRKAESAIQSAPEELAPSFPYRFKLFGLLLPFGMRLGNYDSSFKSGSNRLAFRLPTINQYQYLYSVEADLYRLNGNFSKSAEAIRKLIDFARKDDTKHGHETLLGALMRLGELSYIAGNLNESKNAYTQALETALSTGKMNSYYLAEKNLMTIYCREIENAPTAKQRSDMAKSRLGELAAFQKNYIDLKQTQAQKELGKKNRKLKLTLAEKSQVEKEAITDIRGILLYRGIFEAFSSNAAEITDLDEKFKDLAGYMDSRKKRYLQHVSALSQLEGVTTVNAAQISLYDRKNKRQTAMILEMNKGLVLESLGRTAEALDIYLDISNRAYEFKANDLFVAAGYRSYALSKSLHRDVQKILRQLDTTFKANPYLIKKHPGIYAGLADALLQETLDDRQYYNAMYLENYNRMLRLQNTLETILNDDGAWSAQLNEYREFDTIEEILSSDIEELKIKRESTETLEAIMDQLQKRKKELKQAILQNPKLSGLAVALFADLLTVNDIRQIKQGFLYLLKKDGQTRAIYKLPGENNFEVRTFAIDPENLQKFIEYRGNTDEVLPETAGEQAVKAEGDLKRFIDWIRGKKIEIVFPDQDFAFFPFSKILQKHVARDYTFQASLLFQKNQSVSTTNLLQNHNVKTAQDENDPQKNYVYNYAGKPGEVQNLRGKYNVVDYEITDKDFSDNPALLRNIVTNNENVSLTMLSYNLKDKSKLHTWAGALNLLFAASRSAIVVQALEPRKTASAIFDRILNRKSLPGDNFFFDANLEVVRPFFNGENPENNARFTQYLADDLRLCLTEADTLKNNSRGAQTDTQVAAQDIGHAIEKTNFCENIDYNLKITSLDMGTKSGKSPEEKPYIKPNFDLFYKKLEMMFDPQARYKISDIEKTFETFRARYTRPVFKDPSEMSVKTPEENIEFYKHMNRYIGLLLENGNVAKAVAAYKSIPAEYAYGKDELLNIAAAYYLGQMRSGTIEAFAINLPDEIASLDESGQAFAEIPKPADEKISYFSKRNDAGKWLGALINAGLPGKIGANFANRKWTTWQAIQYVVVSKNPAEAKTDVADALLMEALKKDPGNTEIYEKIQRQSNDPYCKSLADLIKWVHEKKYDSVFAVFNSLVNSPGGPDEQKDNMAETGFLIKQTFAYFVMQHVDFYTMPEDFVNGILRLVSSTKLDYKLANKQQQYFSKLVSSTASFVNNPGELYKFLAANPEGLSEMNNEYLRRLMTLSMELNPFEALNRFEAKIPAVYLGNDYISSLEKLKKQIGDTGYTPLSPDDASLSIWYHVKSKNYQKALYTWFGYDRNQQPEEFAFGKTVHGILKLFRDQYYHWSWNQKGVEFTRLKLPEFEKVFQKYNDDIFYLPAKDETLRGQLLHPDARLRYFTSTAKLPKRTFVDGDTENNKNDNKENLPESITEPPADKLSDKLSEKLSEKIEGEEKNGPKRQPEPGEKKQAGPEITWSADRELVGTPGYALLEIYLPRMAQVDEAVTIGYTAGLASSAFINFYSQPLAADSENTFEQGENTGKFHIFYTKPEALKVYLKFIKEFCKQSAGDMEKMDTPSMVFENVFKKLEKANENFLNHIIVLQK